MRRGLVGVVLGMATLTAVAAAARIDRPVMFDTPEADAICAALRVFPPDHAMNQEISDWPVHPNSRAIVASIGRGVAGVLCIESSPATRRGAGRRHIQPVIWATLGL